MSARSRRPMSGDFVRRARRRVRRARAYALLRRVLAAVAFVWAIGFAAAAAPAVAAPSAPSTPARVPSAAPAPASANAANPAPDPAPDPARRLPRAQLVDHLVRVAEHEWRDWGRTMVDVRSGVERVERVGATEVDRAWSPVPEPGVRRKPFDAAQRVRRYWHEGLGVNGRPSRDGIDIDTAARTQPWSAVFVSWLMRSVGVAEAAFPATDRHAAYLRAVRTSAQFELLAADEVALARGDLVCGPRDSTGEAGWLRLQAMRSPDDVASLRAAHCDLVVAIDARAREARLIGGNVEDSVALTRIALTADGRVIRTLARPSFVLVRSR